MRQQNSKIIVFTCFYFFRLNFHVRTGVIPPAHKQNNRTFKILCILTLVIAWPVGLVA